MELYYVDKQTRLDSVLLPRPLCIRVLLTILKASFFLLDEMAIICASWLNVTLVTSVVKFKSSRIGLGDAPANRPPE